MKHLCSDNVARKIKNLTETFIFKSQKLKSFFIVDNRLTKNFHRNWQQYEEIWQTHIVEETNVNNTKVNHSAANNGDTFKQYEEE